MAKIRKIFSCNRCGATYGQWQGQCGTCAAWNSIFEKSAPQAGLPVPAAETGKKINCIELAKKIEPPPRLVTGLKEFDRVIGMGLVRGSAILVGGDPGIGKSTILLQVAGAVSKRASCLYVSGEEALDQIQLRATRLGLSSSTVKIAEATNVSDIYATLNAEHPPDLVIIDSIQTMYVETVESTPGSVSQVRNSADILIRLAKQKGFTIILVGHVTKEGNIAGPRVLEHMVDTVLYFEGDNSHHLRLLRAIKNRFGATDELGVFEMTEKGLAQVENPSSVFLSEHRGKIPGTAVFAGIEGTRPILMEIQALVLPSRLGTPRRAIVGWDSGRLAIVLAVLEARCKVAFTGHDVYLNVAGGLRISEPAADLAVAAALVSAVLDQPLTEGAVVFGEIGLSAEIRSVSQTDLRLKEAKKLGFSSAWGPHHAVGQSNKNINKPIDLPITEMAYLDDMIKQFDTSGMVNPTSMEPNA